ncbi:hypothetical protein, partial [Bradyrhizobium sp. NBAIM08]|uniref:hypothetical protein n=1 Tax=Bradyrhizobium sp. NBAIM08 TaxID=2793815 RepID=UPI001CD7C3E3
MAAEPGGSSTPSHLTPWKSFRSIRAMKSPKPARLFPLIIATCFPVALALAEVNKVEKIAPDVYFHEGDIKAKGHCNNGWIVFED